jgi:hypothetical protein
VQPEESEIQDKWEMRFGVNGGMYPDISQGAESIGAVTRQLDRLGMVWLRHPGRGTAWFEVQPTRDAWDFRKLDAVVRDNDHPWVIEIYGATGTVYPFGGFSEETMRTLGDKRAVMDYVIAHSVDLSHPEERADAETYVKTFVGRYRDVIRYWEIGNEGITSPGRLDIVVSTYAWIKEVHPDAVVLLTAVAGDDDATFQEGIKALDSLLAAGAGDHFDVANIHYYGRIEEDFEDRLEQQYDDYLGVLEDHRVSKPIWVTETSTSSDEDSVLSGPSSEQTQARHVVKRLVIFSAKGAQKVFWHDYRDTFEDNKFYQCNLVSPETGRPKPAYYTFKLTVDKLGYYETVETLRRDDVKLYEFTTAGSPPVFVAWSSTPKTLDLTDYVGAEEMLVTHIVEDDRTQPRIEVARSESIQLSPSPVFVEPRVGIRR